MSNRTIQTRGGAMVALPLLLLGTILVSGTKSIAQTGSAETESPGATPRETPDPVGITDQQQKMGPRAPKNGTRPPLDHGHQRQPQP